MSSEYQKKKQFFDNLLTVYGRKPVLEVLQDSSIPVYRLHLADSNQAGGILRDIVQLAEKRGIEIRHHSRDALSRISRNRKQDQGVAADLECRHYQSLERFLETAPRGGLRLLALDRITNPQNLGMIIRSVSASPLDGLILPSKGCAPLSPLVIKASAGTLFRCAILRCDDLPDALRSAREQGSDICVLTGRADQTLGDYHPGGDCIYVLGNETDGVSAEVMAEANRQLKIPMNNGVESLNVAVTASLIAFREVLATNH